MPIRLTPDQESRVEAVLRTGAYSSAEEALDAALTSVEEAARIGFEGEPNELASLLEEGLASKQLTEEKFF